MSHTESMTDSDSNASSSWTFVEGAPVDIQAEKNKYYLNCDSEPIQEFTSNSLRPSAVEPDSDSDGISIISESDDAVEDSLNEEPPSSVNASFPTKEELIEIFRNRNEVFFSKSMIGWILIAAMSPLLLNSVSLYVDEVLDPTRSNVLINDMSMNGVAMDAASKELDEDIIKAPDLPNRRLLSKNSMEKKRKYESKGEADEHRLDCKDNVYAGPVAKKMKVEGGCIKQETNENDDVPSKKQSNELGNKGLRQTGKAGCSNENDFESERKGNKAKQMPKRQDESLNRQKKKKTKKIKANEDFNDNYDEKIKKLRYLVEKKEKAIKEMRKEIKIKDKQLRMLEFKVLKYLNALTTDDRFYGRIPANKIGKKSILKPTNITSGEWYAKMYKARADYRNKGGNVKNNWYLAWMGDREQLRLKRGFWPFNY